VAEDFNKLYKYIYGLLVDANIYKDKELLERALNEIRGMRDTWKQVMARTKNGENNE
jgi:flagellar protein FliS